MTVYLDTNIVIYLVENNPAWRSRVIARLARVRAAGDDLAVGDLTRAECLVGPLRSADSIIEAKYRAFFNDPDIQVLSMNAAVCERAAQIRATVNFEMVDSLHLATAVEHGCGVFLTNDFKLARYTGVLVEVLT